MRLSASTKATIFVFILGGGITLTQPSLVFGAAQSFGGSAGFRASGMHGRRSFSRPFQPFGFFGGDGLDDQQVIIIQQFQSAPTAERSEPAENEIYVPPRWVDGGYGVQVLKPGYWTVSKQAAEP